MLAALFTTYILCVKLYIGTNGFEFLQIIDNTILKKLIKKCNFGTLKVLIINQNNDKI